MIIYHYGIIYDTICIYPWRRREKKRLGVTDIFRTFLYCVSVGRAAAVILKQYGKSGKQTAIDVGQSVSQWRNNMPNTVLKTRSVLNGNLNFTVVLHFRFGVRKHNTGTRDERIFSSAFRSSVSESFHWISLQPGPVGK